LYPDDYCIRADTLGISLLRAARSLPPASEEDWSQRILDLEKRLLIMDIFGKLKDSVTSDEPQNLLDVAECVARESVIKRIGGMDEYTFEEFRAITYEKTIPSATYLKHDLSGKNNLLVRTVYKTEQTHPDIVQPLLWGQFEIEVRTSFESLFSEGVDSERAFEKTLLLDENNRVLYQGGDKLPRFASIDSLIVNALQDGTFEPKDVRGYSDVHRVKLGNKTFHAYIHPLQVDLISEDADDPDEDEHNSE